MERSELPKSTITSSDTQLEKWLRGPSFHALQVTLQEMNADGRDVDYFVCHVICTLSHTELNSCSPVEFNTP